MMNPLIPIYVPLREIERAGEPEPTAQWLLQHLTQSAQDFTNVRHTKDCLVEKLTNGECIVLLDGIDEAPNDNENAVISRSISAFARKYGENKIITTCRTASYRIGLEGFQICEKSKISTKTTLDNLPAIGLMKDEVSR